MLPIAVRYDTVASEAMRAYGGDSAYGFQWFFLLEQVTAAQRGKTLLISGHRRSLGRLMMCVDEVILLATSSGQESTRKVIVGNCTPVVSPEPIRSRGAYVEVEGEIEGIPCAVR